MASQEGNGRPQQPEPIKTGDHLCEVKARDGNVIITIGVEGITVTTHTLSPQNLVTLMQACAAAHQVAIKQLRQKSSGIVAPPSGFNPKKV